jgi:hypothetical protein
MSLADLLPCPVRVRLHTDDFIDGIAQSASGGKAVPGIDIARVPGMGKKAFIVDGHARVDGYQKAGIDEIEIANELKLKSEAEVVAEHVRRNLSSSVNPLKLTAAITFLESKGVKDASLSVGLSEVMRKAILVLRRWPKDVRAQFSQFLDQQAERFSDVHVPPQFFIALGQVTDDDLLRQVITYIIRVLQNTREANEFSLPGPDQVRLIIESNTRQVAAAPAAGGFGGRAVQETVARERREEPRDPVMPDKHKSHIHCTSCGADNVVDLKNGHACQVEQVGGVQVIRDGDGLPVYALSKKSIQFLNLDAGGEFKTIMSDKKSDAEHIIKNAKPSARFVIILVE